MLDEWLPLAANQEVNYSIKQESYAYTVNLWAMCALDLTGPDEYPISHLAIEIRHAANGAIVLAIGFVKLYANPFTFGECSRACKPNHAFPLWYADDGAQSWCFCPVHSSRPRYDWKLLGNYLYRGRIGTSPARVVEAPQRTGPVEKIFEQCKTRAYG